MRIGLKNSVTLPPKEHPTDSLLIFRGWDRTWRLKGWSGAEMSFEPLESMTIEIMIKMTMTNNVLLGALVVHVLRSKFHSNYTHELSGKKNNKQIKNEEEYSHQLATRVFFQNQNNGLETTNTIFTASTKSNYISLRNSIDQES